MAKIRVIMHYDVDVPGVSEEELTTQLNWEDPQFALGIPKRDLPADATVDLVEFFVEDLT